MILQFIPDFVEPILTGVKIHTMREDAHGRWKAGRKIQMTIHTRTKEQSMFAERECTGVQDVKITYIDDRGAVKVEIDGAQLGVWHRYRPDNSINPEAVEALVKNDGFESVRDFLQWFQRDYNGKIIHWTPYRYDTKTIF